MTAKYFLKKIKDVKINDLFSVFKLAIAILLKPLYHKHKGCWVICEAEQEARDNGYHFYKYVRQICPTKECYYAIKKSSPDYSKVAEFGNVIEYGSLKHWILYLCAQYNISSQKGGKPNAALCAFLELMGMIDSKLVFLQHGIIINDVAWVHADITQLKYFVTSTIPEYEYVVNSFGYDPDKIVLTGLPRFDNLHDCKVEKNYVLIMPTWRGRFTLGSEKQKDDNDFKDSNYKKNWEELLNSPQLIELMKKYNLKVVFFPHRNMQKFLDQFIVADKSIVVADWKDFDIQEEMKKAAMMITDYSSVFFDMVYMKKLVIFFQFDYDDFRQGDYAEGYFDYRNNPFSKWSDTVHGTLQILESYAESGFVPTSEFLDEHKSIFSNYDTENSKRLFEILNN